MGKYTTKKTDEEGNAFWESTDGSSHKSRKSAWEHSKSLLGETETKTESEREPITVEDETPQWASFDFGASDGEVVEVIPSTLKKIKGASPTASKKTKRQLEVERLSIVTKIMFGLVKLPMRLYRKTGYHWLTWYLLLCMRV